jgi:hypothetical protein
VPLPFKNISRNCILKQVREPSERVITGRWKPHLPLIRLEIQKVSEQNRNHCDKVDSQNKF